MNELPLTPPPAGLTTLGSDDAAMCVDGVCAVPDAVEQGLDETAAELPR
ncbi:hypothetical protein [Georgenia sp. H159]|nr:hypothetical protein [Georgenia sp. H159]